MNARWLLALVLFVALGSVLVSAQAPDLSRMDIVERSLPDGPVALVDNVAIPREDFLFLYRAQLAGLAMESKGKDVEDSTRIKVALRSLADLVQREVLYQEGVRRGIKINEEEVTAAFEKRVKGLQEQAAKHGTQAPSAEEILKKTGETREGAYADLRKSMMVRKTREAIGKDKKLSVTEKEIKEFYTSKPELFQQPSGLHLFQLFIQPKPNARKADEAAWDTARKEIEKALARIRAGESFESVAKAVSEAPDRARGGDMGMMAVSQLPAFLLAAAEKLKAGDMSAPIRSEYGWHIIKFVAREDAKSITLEEARDRISDLLMDAKIEAAAYDFCQPILDNPEHVRFYLQLERTLANMPEFAESLKANGASGTAAAKAEKASEKPAAEKSAVKSADTTKKAEPAKSAPSEKPKKSSKKK